MLYHVKWMKPYIFRRNICIACTWQLRQCTWSGLPFEKKKWTIPHHDQIPWLILFPFLHVNSQTGIFSFRTILDGICKNFGPTLTGEISFMKIMDIGTFNVVCCFHECHLLWKFSYYEHMSTLFHHTLLKIELTHETLGEGYLELTCFTFTAIHLKWFKIITSNLA